MGVFAIYKGQPSCAKARHMHPAIYTGNNLHWAVRHLREIKPHLISLSHTLVEHETCEHWTRSKVARYLRILCLVLSAVSLPKTPAGGPCLQDQESQQGQSERAGLGAWHYHSPPCPSAAAWPGTEIQQVTAAKPSILHGLQPAVEMECACLGGWRLLWELKAPWIHLF